MKTASGTNTSAPATDGQYGELKTMFEHTARKAVSSRDQVQNLLGRWDKIGPLIAPTLLRFSHDPAPVVPELLEPVSTVSIPAFEFFVAKDSFKIGTQEGVKIGFLGNNFKKNFLGKTGKSELDTAAQNLRVHKLRKSSCNVPIIKELGSEELIETTLSAMWELMKKQGMGQAGDLAVKGYDNLLALVSGEGNVVIGNGNIFYVRDDSGTLWAVSCHWDFDRGHWRVYASSVAVPSEWSAGYRFFSR